ncbi:hypothetical protein [Corallococcus exercitus]|uniref:Uncharacterized protein n=1 Tax=Corallococcus exercitus TaxID=2316736 RepID=A0A7Y4JUL0_9BACT|nr:hypothetical protein [Corallococcus exercitus]NOK11178.1 hypothetical protein [Corallococcus exercitus]
MRLWIALVAGLSLGQTVEVEPLPPKDPSVRDPAAAALQDAYEQAADDLDGARPPQGYVVQNPSDPTESNYRTLTPVLPDGNAPVTSGEVAVQESQKYVAPPVPTVFDQQAAANEPAATAESQPQSGTGGAGAAGTSSTEGGTTAGQSDTGAGAAGTSPAAGPTSTNAPGFGGTYDTGASSSAVPGNVASGSSGVPPLDSSSVTVQEPGTATGGAGGAGTTGTGTTTPETATGGAGTTGTGTATPETATGGSGTAGTTVTATPETATGGSGAAGTTGTTAPGAAAPTTPEAATGGSGTGTAAPSGSTAVPPTGTTAPAQGGTSAVTPSGQTTSAQPQAQGAAAPNANAANEELKALRQRIADLEQDLEARDTRATERTQAVQSQVDTHEQRAYQTERSRQQRLARIQSGGQWMLAADQALEQGELGVDNALGIADQDFSAVHQSASTDGQGNVVVQAERIRAQIALARDAAGRRDIYAARIALQNAGYMLQLARAANLERSGTSNSLLNP